MRSHSQPAGLPSQFPQPGLQVKPHVPAPHVATACCGVVQTLPHEPQFETSLLVLTSQPFVDNWSQSAKGGLQVAFGDGGCWHDENVKKAAAPSTASRHTLR